MSFGKEGVKTSLMVLAFGLAILAAIAYGVWNFISWRECVDAGGVYLNSENSWPSCFYPMELPTR